MIIAFKPARHDGIFWYIYELFNNFERVFKILKFIKNTLTYVFSVSRSSQMAFLKLKPGVDADDEPIEAERSIGMLFISRVIIFTCSVC